MMAGFPAPTIYAKRTHPQWRLDMKYERAALVAMVAIMSAPTLAIADDDELEFDEAFVYFELNDTDGDLGIHGKVDGDAWKKVAIEGPNDRKLLDIKAKSGIRRQGLTELFFESAEPTFDELDPEVFFNRFPEGEYEWEGVTLDGEEIEGEVFLSHVIPAAPVVLEVGGQTGNPGFDEDEGDKVCWEDVETDGGVVIVWEEVTQSHFQKWNVDPQPRLLYEEEKIPLGVDGPIDVVYYEFVAEIDDTEYKSTALIPAGITEWTVPEEFIELAEGLMVENDEGELEPVEEIKFEIIVRVESGAGEDDDSEEIESTLGNQSAVEDCFEF